MASDRFGSRNHCGTGRAAAAQQHRQDAGHGVEDEHPHQADADAGQHVRGEDGGAGEAAADQLPVQDGRERQPQQDGAADGGDGEDQRGAQHLHRLRLGEELDVVAEPTERA